MSKLSGIMKVVGDNGRITAKEYDRKLTSKRIKAIKNGAFLVGKYCYFTWKDKFYTFQIGKEMFEKIF